MSFLYDKLECLTIVNLSAVSRVGLRGHPSGAHLISPYKSSSFAQKVFKFLATLAAGKKFLRRPKLFPGSGRCRVILKYDQDRAFFDGSLTLCVFVARFSIFTNMLRKIVVLHVHSRLS